MVERTGPKARTMATKLMPEMATDPTPWNSAWKAISPQGACASRVGSRPDPASSANSGT